jgi:ABC-2 type transport system ATP-binding protein
VRDLARDEGVGVLWTTHLVDEIRDEDHVVVLHKGKKLADAACGDMVASVGAAGIGAAFTQLTGAWTQEEIVA